MSSKPDLCIAIPTFQRDEVLLDTINDSLAQSHKNIEVLVVDQSISHSPKTIRAIKKINDRRFRYYRTTPPSVTAARNFALKHSKAPIVLFLDDDVRFDKNLAGAHLLAHAEHPEVSAVAGRVLQKGFPVKKDVLRFDEFGISHGVFTATNANFTNAFPGGNHSIKVKDALRIGGFDTRYYYNAFREENDMSIRLTKAGMKIFYEPRAVLTHLAAPKGGSRAKKQYKHLYDTAHFYRNELFFTLRVVEKKYLFAALKKKYIEYCPVPSRKQGLKRRVYFALGMVAALWRILFGKQRVSREMK